VIGNHTKLVKDEIARFQDNVATLGELVRSVNDSLREVGVVLLTFT
jgi:hypothetical protein